MQNLIFLIVSISCVPLQIIREIDFPAYFENKFSAMELFNGAGGWKVLYSCFFKGLFTPYVHENRENRAAFPCRDVFPSTFMCVSVRFLCRLTSVFMYISYVSCLHHSVCHVCFIFRAENCIHVADSCTEKKSTSDTSVEV